MAHEMRWRCKCRCIVMLLLACPVEATRCGAAALFIKNVVEKETINVEKILFTLKLKPSRSHRSHILCIFYRDIYQRCTLVSHKKAACLENHAKLMQVQLWKTYLQTLWQGFFFPITLQLMFLNEKVVCVIGFRPFVCTTCCFVYSCLSNLIIISL